MRPKFYHLDVDIDDDVDYEITQMEQSDDKWGTSAESNAKVIRDIYHERLDLFTDMCEGKVSESEYHRVDAELEARENEPK
jgi:hypothetical protein